MFFLPALTPLSSILALGFTDKIRMHNHTLILIIMHISVKYIFSGNFIRKIYAESFLFIIYSTPFF